MEWTSNGPRSNLESGLVPGGRSIQEGECEVLRDEGGTKKQIAVLRSGDYFGEMAVLSDLSLNATVRALSPTNVLVIPKDDFDMLTSNVPVFDQFFRELAQKRARG